MVKKVIPARDKNEFGMDGFIWEHYTERAKAPKDPNVPKGPVVCGINVGAMRYPDDVPSYPLIDLAKDIVETDYQRDGYMFRHYVPKGLTGPAPCMFYIHGGGWCMGALKRLNNINRRIAEVMNGVVIYVDYTLSPEAVFPTAVNQCYEVLKEVHENPEKYGVDPERIAVMGDSAGGNITASVAILDRETHYMDTQILYYPALDFSDHSYDVWDFEAYGKNLHPLVAGKTLGLYKTGRDLNDAYLRDTTPADDEIASPLLYHDFKAFPPTIMLTAEYDFLRQQCEEFVQKLEDAGVKVDYVMYEGTFHGYLERLGFFWQSDDSVHYIVDKWYEFLKEEGK